MKTLIASLVLASLALVGSAEAKPRKAAKPVMCVDYAIVVDAAAQETVAVCYDKHVEGGLTLTYWKELTLTSTAGPVTVVVGYR
jgi:hypothetical protein